MNVRIMNNGSHELKEQSTKNKFVGNFDIALDSNTVMWFYGKT